MDLRDRIRAAIEQQGTSARAVSLAAGLSDSGLPKYLTGQNKSMTLDTLTAVARALGKSPQSLAFGESGSTPADDDLDFEERTLVDLFRKLSEANRRLVVQLARSLSETAPGSVHTPTQGYKSG